MNIKDFPKIHIDPAGQYYVVPHDLLTELLELAKQPPQGFQGTKFLAVRTEVGKLIRQFRDKMGWTQEDLVAESKEQLSLRTITNLEGGKQKRKPHFSTIEILISVLGDEFKNELGKIIPIAQEEFSDF